MAANEKKRLFFTSVAVILVGTVTGLFLGGNLLPSRAANQLYDEKVTEVKVQSVTVHAHDDVSVHEHKVTTVVTVIETTPHGYFHDFTSMIPSVTTSAAIKPLIPSKIAPNEVWIINREFLPQTMTVKAGTTLTWTNKDMEEHTVTFSNGLINMRLVARGVSFNYTFTERGTFDYYCDPHREMKGKLIVE